MFEKFIKSIFAFFSFILIALNANASVNVPFTMTEALTKDKTVLVGSVGSSIGWGNPEIDGAGLTGVCVGDFGGGFNWDDKYVDIAFLGVPDTLSFDTEAAALTTGVAWYVKESSDGKTWSSEIWSASSRTLRSVKIPLSETTRYVRLCYSGNFRGCFSDVTISAKYRLTVNDGDRVVIDRYFHKNESLTLDTITVTSTSECQLFKGWDQELPTVMPSKDLVINALYEMGEVSARFVTKTPTVSVDDYDQKFTCGEPIEVETPTQKGYTFDGWDPELPAVASSSMDGMVYTAQWKRSEYRLVVYTTDEDSVVEYHYYGDELTPLPTPVRNGYVFDSWSAALPSAMPAEDLIIKALWRASNHSVYFMVADTVYFSKQFAYGETLDVKELNEPVCPGYTFVGWDGFPMPTTMPDADLTYAALWSANSYKLIVVLDSNDPTLNDTVTYDCGSKIETLNDPERVGYTFDGWDIELPDLMPAENIVVTAKWKANPYKLIVVNNSTDATKNDTTIYDCGAKIESLNDPEREGYTFDGWDEELPEVMPAQDVVIAAKWIAKTYKLIVVNNIDNLAQNDTFTYKCDAKIQSMFEPEREGYTFDGWDIQLPEVMPAHNVIVTAKWIANEYNLSFYSDDELILSIPVAYGSAIPYEKVVLPTKDGFQFLGWDENPETMPANDVRLTANWSANAYRIVVVNDDADVSKNDTFYYECTSKIQPLREPVKEGYTFKGWNRALPENMPAEDIVMTALWNINSYELYTLVNCQPSSKTYVYGDAVNVDDPKVAGYKFNGWSMPVPTTMTANNVLLIADMTLLSYDLTLIVDDLVDVQSYSYTSPVPSPENPSKEGYTFEGWQPAIPEFMPDSSVVCEAQWSLNHYTINYVVEEDTVQVTYGYGEEVIPQTQPSMEGYTFLGWSEDEPQTMPASDLTLEAEWKVNVYTLSVVVEGDTTQYRYSYGQSVPELDEPSQVGYEFVGWSKTLPATMPAYNDTVVALWKVNQYTIDWIVDNDTTTQTYDFGSEVVKMASPEKEGYTFLSWNVEVPTTMPAQDLTIEAEWSINQYELTYDVDGKKIVEKYSYGQEIVPMKDPSKVGFTFAGWSADVPEKMPAHDVELTALWNESVYELSFIVGADTFVYRYNVGDKIAKVMTPSMDGYEFVKWSDDVPEVMPAHNVELIAEFKAKFYNLIVDDGVQVNIMQKAYKEPISLKEPSRVGYTFSKWNIDVPALMPDSNLTIVAVWTANKYNFTVRIPDIDTFVITYDYGQEILPVEEPSKEGYTFVRWSDTIPHTMPAHGVTVEAQFAINTYELTVVLKKDSVEKLSFEYGSTVKVNDPMREGYEFVGWRGELPKVMPSKDITIEANWKVNEYDIVYVVDNDTTIVTYKYSSPIDAFDVKDKEGYSFTGWNVKIPATMPAKSFVAKAQWKINVYNFTYVTKTKAITVSYQYGDSVARPADPSRKGYTFTGWSDSIPVVMPAKDVKVNAVWAANAYSLILLADGKVIRSSEVLYGEDLDLPETVVKCGYSFVGWEDFVPTKMPAQDVILRAKFKAIGDLIAYSKDGKLYITGIQENVEVVITDCLGRLIYQGRGREINLAKNGVYVIRAGKQTTKVLIK